LRIQSGYFGVRDSGAWIEEVMQHLDLASKAEVNMRALSGGMKRRVLVAQALVHKPPVIVLDEPTAGVDVELRHALWQFIRRLNRDGHTIVLTTHYLEEAEALCARIAMLKQGRVVALDSTSNLLKRVHHLFLRLRLDGELPDELRPLEHGSTAEAHVLRLKGFEGRPPHRGNGAEATRSRRRLRRCDATLMSGFPTLLYKEVLRFWKVSTQTIGAPVLSAVLFLFIFSHVMEGRTRMYDTVPYAAFLVPGLVMMSVLQNAFANTSSSLVQSKMTGNIIFVLLPPLAYWEFFAAYVLAAVVRGMAVGAAVLLVTLPFVEMEFRHPLWIVAFAFSGSAVLGSLGMIAGIWAEKIDQVAAFQNFFIMPLTFLSGVFYSIHSLPAFWQGLSHFNPFFYMIDGFRYGFFGVSDVHPFRSLAVVAVFLGVVSGMTLAMLKSGYRLRH